MSVCLSCPALLDDHVEIPRKPRSDSSNSKIWSTRQRRQSENVQERNYFYCSQVCVANEKFEKCTDLISIFHSLRALPRVIDHQTAARHCRSIWEYRSSMAVVDDDRPPRSPWETASKEALQWSQKWSTYNLGDPIEDDGDDQLLTAGWFSIICMLVAYGTGLMNPSSESLFLFH